MLFTSKPHTIEAFQFTGERKTKPPKWVLNAYNSGSLRVIMNEKNNYIIVDNDQGSYKANIGDWVCINKYGTMFVLRDAELKADFDPDSGGGHAPVD